MTFVRDLQQDKQVPAHPGERQYEARASAAAEDPARLLALQQSAGNAAVTRLLAAQPRLTAPATAQIMRHPAATVLRRAGRWLLTRGTRMISKHIARHGRRIAGRATHSVFRIPRKIRSYVQRAIREAELLARGAATHGADDVLEGEGIRVFREAVRGVPGKFRTHIEREFRSAIGTRGERILKIVIDSSGRLVTAYPIDRFSAIAVGAGAIAIFDTRTAEASERIRSRIEAEEQEEETDMLTTILDFIFDPSVANEGEDLMLDIDDIVEETTRDVVRDIEEEEGVCLEEEDVEALRDLVAAAISTPMILDDPEAEWDDGEEE